ncbi:ABC transporter ATP-binding protein [Paenibacillus chungangensis]|uniref:ATP-binding cassette domain-containing protein n=1 Tax=Paenibacillus chungangensis TaxID=696535 RepID=A0ABW3HWS6_9BACL
MELLQVKELSKSFGSARAVKGISFDVHEGRCVALLGPNGAGKTTTIRMLAGLLKQTAGQIHFHGADTELERKSLLGYLPQSPTFYGWMTGLEYVSYIGKLSGMGASEAKKRALALMERVGIGDVAKRRIRGYSGGMKQRLGLAQALVNRPKLLIMDEPVSALDPIGRREVLKLLEELKRETTVLFSTHVLHDAEELCDDVVIIRSGEIALQGSLNDVRNRHRHSVIELRLEEDERSLSWLSDFAGKVSAGSDLANGHALFKQVEVTRRGVVKVIVDDINSAREWLLHELAEERVKVNRMEIGHSSLEDLFMKVVAE